MTPLVTVGIPFHNEGLYLREAVASILSQSFRELEVLLVDDGSIDDSLSIARTFQQDPRVRVLSDGARRGLPARLNEIAGLAQGAFLARMDGDDISHPNRIARELARFERDSSLDVVGTWIALVDERCAPIAISEYARSEGTMRTALRRGLLPHATILGRTAWFRANPYDAALDRAEDRDLWCRCVATVRFDVVPEPLYLVRVLPRDADFMTDYRDSQRQNRMLFVRYGPEALGVAGAALAYAGTYAKSFIMSAALRAGIAERLVRRRGRVPTTTEATIIREAVDAVTA